MISHESEFISDLQKKPKIRMIQCSFLDKISQIKFYLPQHPYIFHLKFSQNKRLLGKIRHQNMELKNISSIILSEQYNFFYCVYNLFSIQTFYKQMYRNHSPFEAPEHSHKDDTISTLKRELQELQNLQTDFLKLNEEMSRLESKYSLLLEQKERSQKQHKLKIDINKKVISDMRSDIDSLKLQIHKTSTQVDETLRENTTMKRVIDNRNNEITGLLAKNTELEKRNELQAEENRNISFNIKQLKEQKAKLQTECERIHSLLDENVKVLKNTQKEVRVLESKNAKLDSTLAQAQRDNEQLLLELKAKQTSLSKTVKALDVLKQKTDNAKQKNNQLQSDCRRFEGDIEKGNNILEAQITKNRELGSKLKNLDNLIKATEQELQQAFNKKEGLKKQHFDLIADNKDLNTEIDNSLLSIMDYQKLNAQLQKQIENYIDTDEQARNLLNRKNVMKSLLEQVNTRLEKTSEQISHLR